MVSVLTGRLRDTVELGEDLDALSSRVGHATHIGVIASGLTYHHLVVTGNLAASEARARRDVEDAERSAIGWRRFSYVTLGLAHFFAGDWTSARSAFDTALDWIRAVPMGRDVPVVRAADASTCWGGGCVFCPASAPVTASRGSRW